jgi:hypothetical protein
MISQYKREEEEQNKYVDPTTLNEFQYAPAGTVPILSTSILVDVSSLRPATVPDLSSEETNFVKIYEDINDQNKQ